MTAAQYARRAAFYAVCALMNLAGAITVILMALNARPDDPAARAALLALSALMAYGVAFCVIHAFNFAVYWRNQRTVDRIVERAREWRLENQSKGFATVVDDVRREFGP